VKERRNGPGRADRAELDGFARTDARVEDQPSIKISYDDSMPGKYQWLLRGTPFAKRVTKEEF